MDGHGVVEVVGCADGAVVEGAGVGEDGVADVVAAHVCVGIGGFGGAEEGQAHEVAAGCETIFGVVEDGYAVAVFGEIGPFVAADFEFGHIPAEQC